MNPIYYILIGVIALVVAIDLYQKKKNEKSDSTDVDKFIEPSKKKKKHYFLIILLAFLFISIGCVTFLHMQHQSIRNQFETNLDLVPELLQNNQFDYCDSIIKQNKNDLKNKSKANQLKHNLNGSYYKSQDLINTADSLLELIVLLKKDYELGEEKRKLKEKINDLINKAIKTFKIGVDETRRLRISNQLYKTRKKLFPLLKSILKIDSKNKFALYHLSNFNERLASEARFEISDNLEEQIACVTSFTLLGLFKGSKLNFNSFEIISKSLLTVIPFSGPGPILIIWLVMFGLVAN